VGEYINNINDELSFVKFAPVIFMSALTNFRVRKILDKTLEIHKENNRRIPTSELNMFLQKILSKFPPSHASGKHAKIYYCTQQRTNPPVFIFFCNNANLINESYKKYLYNQLRSEFSFEGTAIKTLFRSRGEKDSAQ